MNKTRRPDYPFPYGKRDHPSYALLRGWRQSLEDDRGDRASLRRASNLTEIMLSPAFHHLLQELRQASFGISDNRYPKLAAIAGLIARVKEDSTDTFATRMGRPKQAGNKKSAVSDLRVRRILACDDLEELYTLLRRALALLDNSANFADLAATIWHWTPMDEKSPYDPRRRMAYDYYAAAPE